MSKYLLCWRKQMIDAKKVVALNRGVSDAVSDTMTEWTNTYKNKNANYGQSWLLSGETLSLWFPDGIVLDTPRKFVVHGLITRMLDKIIRAAHLELTVEKDKVGERAAETFRDLGVYGFMAAEACEGLKEES